MLRVSSLSVYLLHSHSDSERFNSAAILEESREKINSKYETKSTKLKVNWPH